jgi:hypothetical protein
VAESPTRLNPEVQRRSVCASGVLSLCLVDGADETAGMEYADLLSMRLLWCFVSEH